MKKVKKTTKKQKKHETTTEKTWGSNMKGEKQKKDTRLHVGKKIKIKKCTPPRKTGWKEKIQDHMLKKGQKKKNRMKREKYKTMC